MDWFTEALVDAISDTIDPDGQTPESVKHLPSTLADSEFIGVELADGRKLSIHIQETE
jgi:hypothetical protein